MLEGTPVNKGFSDQTTTDWLRRFINDNGGAVDFGHLNEAFKHRFCYGLINEGFAHDDPKGLITGLEYEE